MHFIELTHAEGHKVWVNMTQIVAMRHAHPTDGKESKEAETIMFEVGDGTPYAVRETPDEIIRMLPER